MSELSKPTFHSMATNVLRQFVETLDNASLEITANGLLEKATISCKTGTIVFFYAPPEFHVEIIVRMNDGKEYDLAALMSIPSVNDWVKGHQLQPGGDANRICAELEWFVALLNQLRKVDDFKSLLA